MVQCCPGVCVLCAAGLHLSRRVQEEWQARMYESQIDTKNGIKVLAKVKHHCNTCILNQMQASKKLMIDYTRMCTLTSNVLVAQDQLT